MKQLIIIISMSLFSLGFAQDKNANASLEVDGVCGECKARIEKAALRTKGVKSAIWNIDTHELKLIYDERKTNLDSISKKIASVGHDTKLYTASDEAYSKLDACCKYRDEEVVKNHNK
ncbi:MAG: heavy-metal-associated domain-containing protein [Bacteroidota bacterium]